jgi:hypothetical protein
MGVAGVSLWCLEVANQLRPGLGCAEEKLSDQHHRA